jgi:hypothetical protein
MTKTTRTLLLPMMLLAFVPSDASAQSAKDKWSGDAQRCAVEDCSSTTPAPPAESDDPPQQTRRERRAANAQYNKLVKAVDRELALADKSDSPTTRVNLYSNASGLLHAQQSLRDGPNVRNRISQVEAWQLWTQGIVDDQNGYYWTAVIRLAEAYKRRPDLFSKQNLNYKQAVMSRHLGSLPEQPPHETSVVVPDQVLDMAITDRLFGVFSNSPPGVSQRVRRGFEAVMNKDFNLARALFGDALNLDPGNVNLKSFIAIIDQPGDGRYTGLYKESGAPRFGSPLPARFTLGTLQAHRSSMSPEQVMKALDDIIWMQFVELAK